MKNPFENALRIWHKDAFGVNRYVDFMAEFTVSDPEKCTLFLSVNSHYVLYINDKYIPVSQFPDYEFYKVYDEIALASYINKGKNTMKLCAYCQGEDSSTYRAFKAFAIFAVYEGERCVCSSGSDTLTRLNTLYQFDGVENITGQMSYSFRANACAKSAEYEKAVVVSSDFGFYPRPIKQLCVGEPLPAVLTAAGTFTDTVTDTTSAVRMQKALINACAPVHRPLLPCENGVKLDGNLAIIDLRAEQVGYLKLDITLPKECDIYIGWGEHLEDLRVRTSISGRNFAAVYHGHEGRNVFTHYFKRLGLRYLQLHIYAEGATIHYAGVLPVSYPLSKRLAFSCADKLHTRIHDISLRTLQLCMHDHYEDCPWREQALYAMDSRNQMLCGYYTFEEYDFAKASLRLMGKSLREDGLLELTSPGKVTVDIPSFSAVYLLQSAEYLKYSNDLPFIEEMLPVYRVICDKFIARIDETGLLPRYIEHDSWNFYEWQKGLSGSMPEKNTNKVYDAPLCAFVAVALRAMGEICRKAKLYDDEKKYLCEYEKLCNATDKAFWQESKGCYATTLENGTLSHYCQLTQALFHYAHIGSDERRSNVLKLLAIPCDESGLLPITVSHSIFKYDALMTEPEKYGRLVFDELASVFGTMLYSGATSFWETEDGACAFANAGSLCHAWSAIPSYYYLRYCADIRAEGLPVAPEKYGIYEVSVSELECNYENGI